MITSFIFNEKNPNRIWDNKNPDDREIMATYNHQTNWRKLDRKIKKLMI
jgi:hypothetical protein